MKKFILNILGSSGSGKSTLLNALVKESYVERIITDTTREIRDYLKEENGKDYYFRTNEEMLKMIKNNEFVEFTDYCNGDLYGIRKKEIEKKFENADTLAIITDINGNKSLKQLYGDQVITIFIVLGKDSLIDKLENRGDNKESIEKRIVKMNQEESIDIYEVSDFLILNKNFDFALNSLKSIVDTIRKGDI